MSDMTWQLLLESMAASDIKLLLLVPGFPPLGKIVGLQAAKMPAVVRDDLRRLLAEVFAGPTGRNQHQGHFDFAITNTRSGREYRVAVFGSPEPTFLIIVDEWDIDSSKAITASRE